MSENIISEKSLLIVDDSGVSRKILTGIVKDMDFKIDYAVSGHKSIEMIINNNYSCILLDLLMDDGDGFFVLNEMKKLNIKTPVLVVSADIQATTKAHCIELGAVDVVNKPPSKDDLINSINKALKVTGEKDNGNK